LNVVDCNIRTLPSLPEGLDGLVCSENPLQTLPPLPCSLKSLRCSSTQISFLPPLLTTHLWELVIDDTPLKALPELPSNLHSLRCKNTQITVLPELPEILRHYGSMLFTGAPLVLQQREGESLENYNNRWRKWREENASKLRTLERTKVLAEEIIAAAWHPDRFEAWCLDEEEKKENEEMCA